MYVCMSVLHWPLSRYNFTLLSCNFLFGSNILHSILRIEKKMFISSPEFKPKECD